MLQSNYCRKTHSSGTTHVSLHLPDVSYHHSAFTGVLHELSEALDKRRVNPRTLFIGIDANGQVGQTAGIIGSKCVCWSQHSAERLRGDTSLGILRKYQLFATNTVAVRRSQIDIAFQCYSDHHVTPPGSNDHEGFPHELPSEHFWTHCAANRIPIDFVLAPRANTSRTLSWAVYSTNDLLSDHVPLVSIAPGFPPKLLQLVQKRKPNGSSNAKCSHAEAWALNNLLAVLEKNNSGSLSNVQNVISNFAGQFRRTVVADLAPLPCMGAPASRPPPRSQRSKQKSRHCAQERQNTGNWLQD